MSDSKRTWPNVRDEIMRDFGLTRSQANRVLEKLTRSGKIQKMEKDAAQGNALVFGDAEIAIILAAAKERHDNPPEPAVPSAPKAPANGADPAATDPAPAPSGGEDPGLSVETLAREQGPKNTRKSKLDEKKHDAEEDPEPEHKASSSKSWVKWVLIGGVVIAGGLALMAWLRRRNAAAGGGGVQQQQIPAQPQPVDDGGIAAAAAQLGVTVDEYLQLRSQGQVP